MLALFEQGRLGEDAMVRIARRVPASRDDEVAALAPELLIAQLDRLLRSCRNDPTTPIRRPVQTPSGCAGSGSAPTGG